MFISNLSSSRIGVFETGVPTTSRTNSPLRLVRNQHVTTSRAGPLDVPLFIFPDFLEEASRQAATTLCDTLESFIDVYIDNKDSLAPSRDPKIQLADNFAAVGECPPTSCEVEGEIPKCLLGGAYIRNGSNPLFPPTGGYHYFDGHGMLHTVKFPLDGGPPSYCARFTKTSRFLQEKAAGKSLFPNSFGDMMSSIHGIARMGVFAMRAAFGLVDVHSGFGTSNTAVAFYNDRILAMSEEDMPYVIRMKENGDMVTLGRYDFDGQLSTPTCAHPKIDQTTGEIFAFSFNPVINPYIRYFHASKDGKKSPDFPISLQEPCMFHDFAITENYAIFPEGQVVIKLENLVLGKPIVLGNSSKIPRFAVIPRFPTAGAQPKWFEVPDYTSFHYVNAWEEGDEIVIVGSCIFPVERLFENMAGMTNRLMEVHLNMRTGHSYKQHVCSAGIDFGQMNQSLYGRKNRFVYMCYYGPWPKLSGIAKVDLEAARLPRVYNKIADPDLKEPCIVASRRFGADNFCGEPFFVARDPDNEDEDDGYVLTYVHDEKNDVSKLLILDSKSALKTVASITMPSRVPYGFHGIFISANQIARQDSR